MTTDIQTQDDDVVSVTLDTSSNLERQSTTERLNLKGPTTRGILLVKTAAKAAFPYFIMSGIKFDCSIKKGETSTSFSYNGPESADKVTAALKATTVLFTDETK